MPPAILAQTSANGITEPASGDVISGVVTVRGTATDPNYLRYELAFLPVANPDAGWIVFAEGHAPVINGPLALWDTTVGRNVNAPVFPDGGYQLRLRVVRTDYNYNEYFVSNLTVANDQATPTATATPEGTAVDATPAPATPEPQATSAFDRLAPLPTLTPFPTPTPQATPANETVLVGELEDGGEGGGVFGQLAAVDSGRFVRAFWQGVVVTLYIFAAMFVYLVLRSIGRRLWRLVWTRDQSAS